MVKYNVGGKKVDDALASLEDLATLEATLRQFKVNELSNYASASKIPVGVNKTKDQLVGLVVYHKLAALQPEEARAAVVSISLRRSFT